MVNHLVSRWPKPLFFMVLLVNTVDGRNLKQTPGM